MRYKALVFSIQSSLEITAVTNCFEILRLYHVKYIIIINNNNYNNNYNIESLL